jgi:hypothetical protein
LKGESHDEVSASRSHANSGVRVAQRLKLKASPTRAYRDFLAIDVSAGRLHCPARLAVAQQRDIPIEALAARRASTPARDTDACLIAHDILGRRPSSWLRRTGVSPAQLAQAIRDVVL